MWFLIAIISWSVFWLGYSIYAYNAERIPYKYKRWATKQDRPFLFHAEIFISILWSLLGFAALFIYLKQTM
jgi:hypothetical protein